jgi:hypothetical protein
MTRKVAGVDMTDARQAAEVGATMAAAGKAAGSAAIKYTAVGLLFSAIASASVVMAMTMPKSRGDFFASMLSTVMASVCGGAYVSVKCGFLAALLAAQTDYEAAFSLGIIIGIAFLCGLPAWAIVRGLFVWTERRKTSGLDAMIADVRDAIK